MRTGTGFERGVASCVAVGVYSFPAPTHQACVTRCADGGRRRRGLRAGVQVGRVVGRHLDRRGGRPGRASGGDGRGGQPSADHAAGRLLHLGLWAGRPRRIQHGPARERERELRAGWAMRSGARARCSTAPTRVARPGLPSAGSVADSAVPLRPPKPGFRLSQPPRLMVVARSATPPATVLCTGASPQAGSGGAGGAARATAIRCSWPSTATPAARRASRRSGRRWAGNYREEHVFALTQALELNADTKSPSGSVIRPSSAR